MNQDIQENIVTDTTALFARYGFDLTPLGDMYSPFWGEFFSYIQALTKQDSVDMLTQLKTDNPDAFNSIKESDNTAAIYDGVFTDLE